MAGNRLLEKLGIRRHTILKDLLLFFLPWLALFVFELYLCDAYGEGYAGLWRNIWESIKAPGTLLRLPAWRSIGLVLFVTGLTIMIVGQATLWRNYSGFVVIKQDHQLITHGIYRFTRNPIYLGALIVFAGIPIYSASGAGLLAMVGMVPILLHRIGMEERMLAEHFGEAYEAYCRSTSRLIPFVY
jgi:protein-S-isoprenylcysteine O-methyltransferase Ste14